MTVAYRSGAHANGNNQAPAITIPVGVQLGDVLLVHLSQNSANSVTDSPEGLSLLDTTTANTGFPNLLYVGVINGGTLTAGTELDWTLSATKAWSLNMYIASGVDSTAPVYSYLKSAANDGNLTMPTISTNKALWLVEIGSAKSNGTSIASFTAASGWTIRQQQGAYSTFAGAAFIADRNAGQTPDTSASGSSGPATMGTPVASQTTNNNSNTSMVVSLGTTTPGQLNVVEISGFCTPAAADAGFVTPTGWTKVGDVIDTGTTNEYATVYYKVYQSGDGSTVTFNWAQTGNFVAVCTPFSGQATSSPVTSFSGLAKVPSDVNYTASGTTSDKGLLCYGFANRSAGTAWTSLSDNDRGSSLNSGGPTMVCRATAAELNASTSYTKTGVGTNTSVGVGWAFVVKGGVGDGSVIYGGETYTPSATPNIKVTYLVALNPASSTTLSDRYWLKDGKWVGIDRYMLVSGSWV